MLVSKIKPCMSKYILLHSETANGSLGLPRSYAGGFTARLARWSLVFTGCNFKSLEGLSRFGGELSLALVC